MSKTTTTRGRQVSVIPTGFRRDITLLHHLSEMMEKNPALPRPTVSLYQHESGNNGNSISWFLHEDYIIQAKDGDYAAARRVDLEERMAALVLGLEQSDSSVEWEKNDPSDEYEKHYYRLKTTWHGCPVTITTMRAAVCEEVVVLETEHEEEQPDPDVVEKLMADVPLVKVIVKDKITEWQCNERLAAVTAPKHVRTVQVVS